MPYTLLLIDLQTQFEEPDPDYLENITALIVDAINDGADIALVEFQGYGSTWEEVRELLQNYENCFKFRKKDQDGGNHVAKRMKNLKMRHTDTVLVAGLYAEWCVKLTVTTMAEIMPESQFKIKRKACLSYYEKREAWKDFKKHSEKLRNIKFA